MQNIVEKAKLFASQAHKNHTESDLLKTPYIFHLQKVACLVEICGGSDEEISAAWLHDTLEDTEATIDDIKKEFGENIAILVNGLTDIKGWENLPVTERKNLQAEKIKKESNSVKLIKLADQISGGELDAKNTLMSKEDRIEKFEGVKKVMSVCKGVNSKLDKLADVVCEEISWYLNNI